VLTSETSARLALDTSLASALTSETSALNSLINVLSNETDARVNGDISLANELISVASLVQSIIVRIQ
jgi:hypothetical protein